ncbi:MAG TPA: TonB family protein [Steroidobacteraceae bacterium]
MTETEIWAKWESQSVNETYPLRRFLGRSSHSVVFLTEHRALGLADAAIKLMPENPALTESQLARWRTVADLSHPHLLRLFETGRCELGGHPFFFVVMEYAEQTLAQLLPRRALSPDEVRELLPPTLDALGFLHGKELAQGQLKPPNILVVNDQLKLASDTIRAAEGENGAAGDIFSLGLTMAEALTQRPPSWLDGESVIASLPANLPKDIVDMVRQCLNQNSAERPTVAELKSRLTPAQQPPAPAPRPGVVAPATPAATRAPSPRGAPKAVSRPAIFQVPAPTGLLIPLIATAVIVLAATWSAAHFMRSDSDSQLPATGASQDLLPHSAVAAAAPEIPRDPNLPVFVLHQELPNISAGARQSIQGTIKVTVRVTVDASGNVIAEALENQGPSRYFARTATEAARKWIFVPADNQSARKWLLQFEFTRGGASGHIVGSRS